ncbi:hypothetical protein SSS_01960, partial [Sarcoptes scabiei]
SCRHGNLLVLIETHFELLFGKEYSFKTKKKMIANMNLYALAIILLLAHLCDAQSTEKLDKSKLKQQQQLPQRPKIDWGKCPQLEPSEKDIKSKSNILQRCLKENPPPNQDSITPELIIGQCALKIENWFDKKGDYKFEKAEKEIKNKKLSSEMQKALVGSHQDCAEVSKTQKKQSKTPMDVVEQVQIYQGCMDAHITQHCQIKIGA